ncbi:acyltransferase family protein [Microbacterium sp. H1-D42]|uniref:acyltransferase family protein n=1 Tax=Microbacterium sp. H1-D42 TaxID=2925844 RepID=UPI001F5329E8|nr:acyltransferase family protein [Microbacterium sp. H1-D42]UNK71044.1 acyltransferase [Microbacterium sp. H1-D42]
MTISLPPVAEAATPQTPRERPSARDRSTRGPRALRADIQALRAIAVLLVVIYHVRPNRLSGGYIGVDVFFVISGFLITSHLIREATRSGRVKLGAFWAARARRILPASLVAIAVTVCMTAWLAPVTMFDDLRKQALASIFYVQNWVLAADAVDYSAAENAATAFQHFWSLSVEEQFYIFWPVLVIVALWLVARQMRGASETASRETVLRRTLFILFGAVVLVSLAYSIFTVADGQPSAYFVTTTRVWELGAGGLLAAVRFRRPSRMSRYALAYVGLAAIAVSAFVLTNETPFPGLAAVPVILGTAFIILAGTPGSEESGQSLAKYDPWTFGSRLSITQWIGDRSYSLYLWHFPVIILWTMIADRKVDYLDIVGMLVVSFVLAHFSYRFIEQPTRSSTYFKTSTFRSLIAALIAMAAAAALTFAYPVMTARAAGNGDWDALASEARSLPDLGAAAVTGKSIPTFTTDTAAITPNPLGAEQDRNRSVSDTDCVAKTDDAVTPTCAIGVPASDLSVVLVGDSHARMYSTALDNIGEQQGWSGQTYLRNDCPFNPSPTKKEATSDFPCTEPNAKVLEEILAESPDLLVTTWSFNSTFADGGLAASGFADYWSTLEAADIDVLVLRDTPRMDENMPDCIAEHYDDPDSCATPRAKSFPGTDLFDEAVSLAPEIDVANFTDVFCTDDVCKPVIGNALAYYDHHHLTDTFAVSLAPRLQDSMEKALSHR